MSKLHLSTDHMLSTGMLPFAGRRSCVAPAVPVAMPDVEITIDGEIITRADTVAAVQKLAIKDGKTFPGAIIVNEDMENDEGQMVPVFAFVKAPVIEGNATEEAALAASYAVKVQDALTDRYIPVEKAVFLTPEKVAAIMDWVRGQALEESAFGEFEYESGDEVWLGDKQKPMLFGYRFIAEVL